MYLFSCIIMVSTVSLMHHDPDRTWITDPDADHPKGSHISCQGLIYEFYLGFKMDFGLIKIWPDLGQTMLTSTFL